MRSLLDLPPELLLHIIHYTIPVGFEATALSCKTTFAASARFQSQYNLRRKRFRNFHFSRKLEKPPGSTTQSESGESWDEITQQTGICITTTRALLEHIAQDPSVPDYIQSIDLTGHGDHKDEDVHNLLRLEIPETLKDLVRASPIIHDVGCNPDDWMGGIQFSLIDADIFLLTLLSQVQSLALRPSWDDLNPTYDSFYRSVIPDHSNHSWSVLKRITHWANRPKQFPHAPLSKLSTIQPCFDSGYEEKCSMTVYAPFLAIESVSEVFLTSMIFFDDGYTGIAFEPIVNCYSTNLRKLVFKTSVAGCKELEKLLSRIPNLEIFEFSHETKWHGCGFDWNPAAFLDTVQDVCANNLKELSVVVDDPSQWPEGPEVVLTDMTRFEKLAVLEMDVDMLCGTQYDKSMQYTDYLDEFDYTGEAVFPKLVEILPASIEEVKLRLNAFEDEDLECISHLVEDLAGSRDIKLPNLKKLSLFVCVEGVLTLPKKARNRLGAAKRCGFLILKPGSLVPLL
ncbi:hypothetical protein N7478_002184 [Penicillium angulare]|uniref:uncharacterized protein n=1 Tax=Penicillium angulare TaxID=116970 RepID=UPI00253F83A2|nr:uncharacterized protein N7478_002184 [Penicillium angulare]KAJ5289154.1 hypothetical protein N7478_002184 [Penicillium angulare]